MSVNEILCPPRLSRAESCVLSSGWGQEGQAARGSDGRPRRSTKPGHCGPLRAAGWDSPPCPWRRGSAGWPAVSAGASACRLGVGPGSAGRWGHGDVGRPGHPGASQPARGPTRGVGRARLAGACFFALAPGVGGAIFPPCLNAVSAAVRWGWETNR